MPLPNQVEMSREDELLARLGPKVSTEPSPFPKAVRLEGQYIDLIPLSLEHADQLFELAGKAEHEKTWDYLLEEPFNGNKDAWTAHIARITSRDNMVFWAVQDKGTHQILGYLSYLRIDTANRSIEIGNILFSHLLQRSRKSTEAVVLLMRHAFDDLGYRRLEWKCNNLNQPSKSAAVRYGFDFEGIFRKMFILKGRNRDTAWFAIIDDDWPARKSALQGWLDPINFDSSGKQIKNLKEFHADQGHTVLPPPP